MYENRLLPTLPFAVWRVGIFPAKLEGNWKVLPWKNDKMAYKSCLTAVVQKSHDKGWNWSNVDMQLCKHCMSNIWTLHSFFQQHLGLLLPEHKTNFLSAVSHSEKIIEQYLWSAQGLRSYICISGSIRKFVSVFYIYIALTLINLMFWRYMFKTFDYQYFFYLKRLIIKHYFQAKIFFTHGDTHWLVTCMTFIKRI